MNPLDPASPAPARPTKRWRVPRHGTAHVPRSSGSRQAFARSVLARSLLAFGLLTVSGLRADVRCAAVFGDHMVLQRGQTVPIWGTAAPGEPVRVEFAGQFRTMTTTAAGTWRTELDPMAANSDPRTLTVRGRNTLRLSDVLVGEVWLCSGQSNMEKPVGPRPGQRPTDHYREEIAWAFHPLVRLYQVPHFGRPDPAVAGLRWLACTPASLTETNFSAAAYFFGSELQRVLGVPVGLIHSSFGGTRIEAWMPPEAFAGDPRLRPLAQAKYEAYVPGVQATELYRSMIAPFAPFALRGFLWYQGEANVLNAESDVYTVKMRALIESWRAAWREPEAPFDYVLLAPFDYSRWDKFAKHLTPEALPLIWEAQTRALAIPRTGLVVTTDLVADRHDIHPTDKREVGLRLAHLALSDTYGYERIPAHSPAFAAMRILEGGAVEISFRDTGGSLASSDGRPLREFSVAGDDRRFAPAEAKIAGDRVLVQSPLVKKPAAVRFAWEETANPNLGNAAGLPAIPFRSDTWPVAAERPK